MTTIKGRRTKVRGVQEIPKGVEICVATGKRKFASESVASSELKAVRKMRREQRKKKHVENGVYLCVSCLSYHLTSKRGQ